MVIKRTWGTKTETPTDSTPAGVDVVKEKTDTKQPYDIPAPPPPSDPPETEREPEVISTDITELKSNPLAIAEKNINDTIKVLSDVDSDAAVLAVGKLKGALQKLGLKS